MTGTTVSLPEYYNRRAPEYERIWFRDDPVRQQEQKALADEMVAALRNRRILEAACGTGYWTQFVAPFSEEIVAIDSSDEMLALAREKNLDRVRFVKADAYALNAVPGRFNGALANFWFSHVPKSRHAEFLDGLLGKLEPGSPVFMADNVYQPGIGGELTQAEGSADTFKLRPLADGSTHKVLKNYFSASELGEIFRPRGDHLRIHVGHCFWWLSFVTRE